MVVIIDFEASARSGECGGGGIGFFGNAGDAVGVRVGGRVEGEG